MRQSDETTGERLPPQQVWAKPGVWPLVGEKTPRASREPWTVTLSGEVAREQILTLEELSALPVTELQTDIHCVTRWSRADVRFSGILLADLLTLCSPLPTARFVSYVARSERAHSTSLTLDDALALQTLIVLEVAGKPLPIEHGGPVRVVTPGRYFYKSLKWLERIELLAQDRLGWWEAQSGYHNHADPWAEERFIVANAKNRAEVERLLRTGDLSGREFLGVDLSRFSLPGLRAVNALLRNASFEEAKLEGADFSGANLSLSRLPGANLRGASFRGADCEGAHFERADLRGADFSGASLFGATFCTVAPDGAFQEGAILDRTTRMPPSARITLHSDQRRFLEPLLKRAALTDSA